MITIGNYIKSPLNYVGGKFKLLSQILPLFPENINTFVDLFGGGFNVGINVNADLTIYNDCNGKVVEMIEYFIKHNTEKMIDEIHSLIKSYQLSKENTEGFLELREEYNANITYSPLVLYTLICYAFNNQIRFNSKGQYNMPFGKNKSSFNPTLEKKFVEFCEALHKRNIKTLSGDFRKFEEIVDSNYFVYCDPPYYNSTAAYNENGGWDNTDENDLRQMLVNLRDRGVKWALSNNLTSNLTLKKWAENNDFIIYYLNGNYSNCNYHKKNKESKDCEVLIINY